MSPTNDFKLYFLNISFFFNLLINPSSLQITNLLLNFWGYNPIKPPTSDCNSSSLNLSPFGLTGLIFPFVSNTTAYLGVLLFRNIFIGITNLALQLLQQFSTWNGYGLLPVHCKSFHIKGINVRFVFSFFFVLHTKLVNSYFTPIHNS